MSVTITGIFFIALGIFFIPVSNKYLATAIIFFMPFSATAIVNFDSGFWLTPFQFFSLLLIVKKGIYALLNKKLIILKNSKVPIFLLLIFLSISILSTYMPIIIGGDLYITQSKDAQILSGWHVVSYRTITSIVYLSIGVFSSILLSTEIKDIKRLKSAIKTHLISGIFVSSWGYLQFIFFNLNIPYPDFIFNNSNNPVASGFSQRINETTMGVTTSLNLTRIASVATEPSIFAQYILTVLPIFFLCLFLNKEVLHKKFDFFLAIYMLVILLLSTSSSGYMGLGAALFFTIIGLIYFNFINVYHVLTLSLLVATSIIIYLSNSTIREVLGLFIFEKLQSGSGIDRTASIIYALDYFTQYPILGIGWGSATVFDLFSNIAVPNEL